MIIGFVLGCHFDLSKASSLPYRVGRSFFDMQALKIFQANKFEGK
jgi:hypothetical protein